MVIDNRILKIRLIICALYSNLNRFITHALFEVPPAPPYGSITTSFNTSLSVFTCLPGHTMAGPATLGCIDGTHWNGSAPLCQARQHMSDQPKDAVISMASMNVINIQNIVTNVLIVIAFSKLKL